jgi:hypothetical protein
MVKNISILLKIMDNLLIRARWGGFWVGWDGEFAQESRKMFSHWEDHFPINPNE